MPRDVPKEPARRPIGLVFQLRLKQEAEGLSDVQMARRLGISPNMWWRLRHANREVTTDLVRRVLRAWPDDFRHLGLETLLPQDEGPDADADGGDDGDAQAG